MSAVIIEHVNIADLPATWRARLRAPQTAQVTVRIEEENTSQTAASQSDAAVDLLFGIWRDRDDMADVDAYIRKLRAPRFNPDGSRNEG